MRKAPAALLVLGLAGVLAFLLAPYLSKDAAESVNLYCSVDQDQYLPIVAAFKTSTGIEVKDQGETEASRSIGVTQKLALEKDHPVADVLWANEIMNTVYLRDLGVLAPLPPGVAEAFPQAWRDTKGAYVAFAGRARVLLVNTKLLPDRKDWPTRVEDLLDPRFGGPGRAIAVARPLTGTTFTHAVSLLTRDPAKGEAFWRAVAARAEKGEIKAASGNGAVMQLVSDTSKGIAFGLTDTDDARVAVTKGAPVEVIYPDQGEGEVGALVIPNTVALVKGGSNPTAGARLLRWLVSPEAEARLAAGPIANIPLRAEIVAPSHVKRPGADFRPMTVDWDAVGANRDRWSNLLQSLFAGK